MLLRNARTYYERAEGELIDREATIKKLIAMEELKNERKWN